MLHALLFAVALPQRFATGEALWAEVRRAHLSFKSVSYAFRKVRLEPSRPAKPEEQGTLNYVLKGPYHYEIRDNVARINAHSTRDKSGSEWVGARDDENSRNAQGYADYLSNKWSYLPLDLLRGHKTWIKTHWAGGPPRRVEFRKLSCHLLIGKATPNESGEFVVKVWIERTDLTLLRVEEEKGTDRWVTVFEKKRFKK